MLRTIRSSIAAMRALLYTLAAATDRADAAGSQDERNECEALVGLLTPIAKAWCSDTGVAVASLALQVHGGSGYVEESSVAQRLRDSRIGPIYEGTNGIQAIDLVERKVLGDKGEAIERVLDAVAQTVAATTGTEKLGTAALHLSHAHGALRDATNWLLRAEREDRLAGASPYLEMAALTIAGHLLIRGALATNDSDRTVDACFFAAHRVALAPALLAAVTSGTA